ncbi:hypothetical protein HYH70_17875 [Clostridium botulinum]|uniref:hypothetical protein n=1 Tax=Clostridium botulinum TaxID=1491 RepID=UPI00035BA3F6|nr:hypothetical protein [Clostridium botulinum]EPS49013.1 hypothetical protein CFSAN002367_18028 [Clostridium botulinum CFSAN002367]KON09705.1 hypothetical protein ACP52_08495 [Clostridium botulinum]MBY6907437.1 hypothetical protein [Clostridium botulinum]MBY6927749.1 hypothetical protein [Clostridium botulinum]MBY6955089.1 hypothetical protein [Clostridium botulinum]
MAKVMVTISLTKYLMELTKQWGAKEEIYITKTYGGQVWISVDAPGELFREERSNYIEFNDSDMFIKLPKEIHQHFNIKYGNHKTLKQILDEIKELEKLK